MSPPRLPPHWRFFIFDFSYLLGYDLAMQKYIDAHCHILSESQMRDAAACGVVGFVVNGTKPADWGAVVKMANCDNVFGAIGVHPWFVSGIVDDWESGLVDMLQNNSKLMVGEIGLDKNRPDMEKQTAVFGRQLQIAHDFGRVAHIHCVDAWGKMMDILRGCDLPPAMVFHCFSGAPELVDELSKIGAYFSFGVAVCDERYIKMRNALGRVPANRILVESDAPDVALPNSVPNTVAEIARLRGVGAEQIYNNTMGLINDGKI